MNQVYRPPSPQVLRERLAGHLRQDRELAGLSQADAARGVSWSASKLQRIETAVVGISVTDTKALIALYGVADHGTADRLVAMAAQARRRDRFTPYKKYFTAEYQALLSYEQSASEIRSVDSFVLPGLLQTTGYARALLSVRHSGEKLDGLLTARSLRQELLTQEDSPRFVFVVDEAMLHRQIGGHEVLTDQLAHLGNLAERTNLELRIIPFSADAHLGLWEPFMIMTVPGSPLTGTAGEKIVYRETGDTEYLIRDDATRIDRYETGFTDVVAQALSRSDTRHLIDRLKHRLEVSGAASSTSTR